MPADKTANSCPPRRPVTPYPWTRCSSPSTVPPPGSHGGGAPNSPPSRPGRRAVAAGSPAHPHRRRRRPGGLVLAVLAVPGSRRFTVRRCWCVLARHRHPKAVLGSPPAHPRRAPAPRPVVPADQSRGTGAGLCRAGVCAEDFEARIDQLRAACWARDARVTRNARWSQLVTIDVIRRDTLAAAPSSPRRCRLARRWPAVPVPVACRAPACPLSRSLTGAGHVTDG